MKNNDLKDVYKYSAAQAVAEVLWLGLAGAAAAGIIYLL